MTDNKNVEVTDLSEDELGKVAGGKYTETHRLYKCNNCGCERDYKIYWGEETPCVNCSTGTMKIVRQWDEDVDS